MMIECVCNQRIAEKYSGWDDALEFGNTSNRINIAGFYSCCWIIIQYNWIMDYIPHQPSSSWKWTRVWINYRLITTPLIGLIYEPVNTCPSDELWLLCTGIMNETRFAMQMRRWKLKEHSWDSSKESVIIKFLSYHLVEVFPIWFSILLVLGHQVSINVIIWRILIRCEEIIRRDRI